MNNFKKYIFVVAFVVSVLSVSVSAAWDNVDKANLEGAADSLSECASYLSVYIPGISTNTNTIASKVTTISTNVAAVRTNTKNTADSLTYNDKTAAELLYSIDRRLTSSGNDNATWLELINTKTQTISNRLYSGGNSVSAWTELINNKVNAIKTLLEAEKQKEEDALSDYSSSGGRSASDTSSDVGAISGSLSNSFNSGVSASSALNAVQDNQSDFEYFFFGMKNDLNTTGGGASRAPARGSKSVDSGSQVPDFLSDYWEGLNG